MKKLTVDQNKCIGCGTCVAIAPKSFILSDDGKAHPIEPPGDEEEVIQDAVESCPVDAITCSE